MARMLSQVGTVIRGSVGGVTYFANQFHAILMRARVSPVNPQTMLQSRVRAAFTTAALLWFQQIQQVRDEWNFYAQSLTYQGPTGPYTMPGRQVFVGNIGLMKYLQSRGHVFTSSEVTAPDYLGFLGIGDVVLEAPAAPAVGIKVSITNPNLEDVKAVLEISRGFPATRNNYQGPFLGSSLQTVIIAAAATGSVTFPLLTLGSYYFVHIRLIVDDGPKRISPDFIYRSPAFTGVP